ncbi:MAG: M48 family metallopeptidase [Acidobacteria bacterium]|nr:M48 family metallopeptidase [Acidobacteriota bacterium]
MQLGLPFLPETPADEPREGPRPSPPVNARSTPAASAPPVESAAPPVAAEVRFVRRRGARRYILRVLDDGTLRVTVPWWGSKREARAFVESQQAWIADQRGRRAARVTARWGVGAEVLVDGVAHRLALDAAGRLTLAGAVVAAGEERTLKTAVQAWLRARAAATLPGELLALAARHEIAVTRVSIRNQASRWGSCSRRGTISLNWRLVQTPPAVREYVLLHELMHRRELNHSARFWRHVAAVCPGYVEARRWLRVDGAQLFD